MPTTIIAGQWKGQTLFTPSDNHTRPTSVLVRKSLFDIIGHHPTWRQLLTGQMIDICAGAGLVGFEALSRGVQKLLLVESSRHALDAIIANKKKLQVDDNRLMVFSNKLQNLWAMANQKNNPIADFFPSQFIFADPPYPRPDMAVDILHHGISEQILASDGLLVLQTSTNFDRTAIPNDYVIAKERIIGASKVWFLTRALP